MQHLAVAQKGEHWKILEIKEIEEWNDFRKKKN
jgi:hypothetical protein